MAVKEHRETALAFLDASDHEFTAQAFVQWTVNLNQGE